MFSGTVYCVIYTLIHLFIIFYLYTKAEEYGYNGKFWAIAGFFFAIPTLIIFLFLTHSIDRARIRMDRTSVGDQILSNSRRRGIPPKPGPRCTPDPDFHDAELDELIAQRDFAGARKYLLKMLKVARDLCDEQSSSNYMQYETRIDDAEGDQQEWWE